MPTNQPTPSDSHGCAWRRRLAVVLAVLCVASALSPALAGAAVATGPTDAPTSTNDLGQTTTFAQESTPDNSTENGTANESDERDGPTAASQVRITPDIPDADYVSVEVVESDEEFNASGNFATFSLSERVNAVRVQQPGGEARALGDGSAIQIQWDHDAAPGNQGSLYTVELFFADGSTREFEILAHNTDVTASPTIDPGYAEVIGYLEGNAEGMNYDADPEGVQAYIENREERADLFEGLWTDQIETFLALRMAQAFSPLDWVALVAIIGLLAYYINSKHGWMLRIQQFAGSRAELVREAVRQEADEQRNAAAKHGLSDVDGIGQNAERYWRALEVETVNNMIQVACRGIIAPGEHGGPRTDEDGNIILAHQGVRDLERVDPLTEKNLRENTWLKPVLIEGRLRATTALSNIEQALLVAEMEYNRGAEVRETRMKVQELIKDLSGRSDGTDAKFSTEGTLELPSGSDTRDRDYGPGGTPAGGDD